MTKEDELDNNSISGETEYGTKKKDAKICATNGTEPCFHVVEPIVAARHSPRAITESKEFRRVHAVMKFNPPIILAALAEMM